MADRSEVAAKAAPTPSGADVERAQEFAREDFLLNGEGPKDLAPETARRRALEEAIREIEQGAEAPSIQWRQNYSLVLGLERLLSEETPKLADGAELSAHQVDALSGTLAALISELEGTSGDGRRNGATAAQSSDGAGPDDEDALAPDEEPKDWEEEEPPEEEDLVEEAPEDPGASRRF